MLSSSDATLDGQSPRSEGKASFCRLFWLLVTIHVVVWTIVPALVQPSAPLDTVEMRYLGQQWELGYHKHPPLPAWIAVVAADYCGGGFVGIYLVAQLGMAAAFWAVWRLGLEMLSPRLALLGVCLLECLYYYNFATAEFNNNVAMFPYWALAILFLYWALQSGETRYWIATGVCLGLGMLCKYSVAMLIAPMLLFTVVNSKARRNWRGLGPYLTIVAAILVFLPHVIWTFNRSFPTLAYAASRSHGGPPFVGHLLCPLEFLGSQLLVLIPLFWAIIPLTGVRWRLRAAESDEKFNRDFLLAVALGPFLLHLFAAGFSNRWLLSAYGSQLWMFTGILPLLCLSIKATPAAVQASLRRSMTIGIALVVGFALYSIATPYLCKIALRIHCPSQALAKQIEELWAERSDRPLTIVSGDWWLASEIAFSLPNRPTIYGGSDLNRVNMGPACSGWCSDTDLRERGGIVVWDDGARKDDLRSVLRARFPQAEFPPPLTIPWRTEARLTPLQVGVAIIRPRARSGK